MGVGSMLHDAADRCFAQAEDSCLQILSLAANAHVVAVSPDVLGVAEQCQVSFRMVGLKGLYLYQPILSNFY